MPDLMSSQSIQALVRAKQTRLKDNWVYQVQAKEDPQRIYGWLDPVQAGIEFISMEEDRLFVKFNIQQL